ncbi:hypothetical protein [Oceanicola sp. S124]|uniref:hypothetical protein n=1 Tax=Oceanicola sp. S124 TaxID=1042378 RepID=UPI0002E8181B|nr:hypothetical protein [Oceanicola sp. S124]
MARGSPAIGAIGLGLSALLSSLVLLAVLAALLPRLFGAARALEQVSAAPHP